MISTKTSAWLFGILGVIWLGLGAFEIYNEEASIGTSGYLMIGIAFILYSILVFTLNPFAPKMTITDFDVKIKLKILSGSIRILWTDIQSIEFAQYKIDFQLRDRVEEVSYSSNSETSIEIKSAIREVADQKNIQVVGG